MYRKIIFIILFLLISTYLCAQTNVSGDVSGTWTLGGSPYRVLGDITVQNGQILTINAGVQVRFRGNYQFYIYGTLHANGTASDSILFVRDRQTDSLWAGIKFRLASSSCNMTYCRIQDSFANRGGNENYGGGIRISSSSPTITHCVIAGNACSESGGGLAMSDNSSPTIENCSINYNQAESYGGGVYIENSTPTFRYNLISGNRSYLAAGGIYVTNITNPTILSSNIIENNNCTDLYGGGLYIYDILNTLTIDRSIIRNNSATYGGGMYLHANSAYVTLANNLIYGNTATYDGGAAGSVLTDQTKLINNTIYDNSAQHGGGVASWGNGNPTITNSVLWNNHASVSDNEIYVDAGSGGNITVDHSDIQGGYTGTGNINSDPLFENASAHNFRFEANSPLVDAGTNTGAPGVDYDGNARPYDGDRNSTATTDIGAFEYINSSPYITSAPVTTALEDVLYSYQVVAADSDAGDVLTYSLTVSPAFLSINSSTGLISGTPVNSDVGPHAVTVRVVDRNNAAVTQLYTLTVYNVNDAPVAADIPNQTIAEGASFTTITLDNYVNDVDNTDAQMVWTYSGNTQLTVSIVSRVATISAPDGDWNGNETITFRATDPGALYDTDDATFTVTAVNDAPVAADIPNQTIAEGASFTTITLDNYVNDVDNTDAQMVWTYSGNTQLTVSIVSRVATISAPDGDWNGNETITFRATDPGALYDTDDATFTVTVVNDAPVAADIPNQTIAEGASFTTITLDNYVNDVDNTDAQMVWTYSGNTQLTVSIVSRVATISTPSGDWNGSETITFRATDPGALYDTDDATFTVTAVNDAPVAADIPNQTIAEGANFTTISLDNYVNDVDNTDAQMVWTYSGNTQLTVSIVSRVATITPPSADWNGSETITFRATDPGALYDTDDATFTVTAVNDAPVAADIPNQTIAEGASFTTITLDNYVNDVDNTDAQMVWTYSGNTQLTVSIVNRVATITPPSADWNGSETITFRATDPGGLYNTDPATFTVQSVNDPPVAVNDAASTNEDTPVLISVLANDTDSDGSLVPSTVTVVSSPTHGGTSVNTTNGAITFTPTANYNGSDIFTYTVRDDSNAVSNQATVTVTVHSVNDVPVAVNDTTSANEDTPVVISVLANDSDSDGSLVPASVTVVSSPMHGGTSVNTTTGAITFTPTANYHGNDSFTYTVNDDSSDTSNIATVVIVISTINDPPIISAIPELMFNEDDSLVYTFIDLFNHVEDPDTPDSLLTVLFNPGKHVTAHIDTNQVLLKVAANWYGKDTLLVVVADSQFADSTNIYILVQSVNDTPVFINLPDTITFINTANAALTMNTYVQDVDLPADSIRWQFAVNKDSIQYQYNAVNSELTLTAPGFLGIGLLTVTVTDDSGAVVSEQVVVKVNPDPTGIFDLLTQIPTHHVLNQNYPNPFNPLTRIKFGLPLAEKVKIEVFNILGQQIKTVLDEFRPAGYHIVEFNASALPSGLYFYRIQTKEFSQIKKMILVK